MSLAPGKMIILPHMVPVRWAGHVMSFPLHDNKLRLREVKSPAPGHTAGLQQKWI